MRLQIGGSKVRTLVTGGTGMVAAALKILLPEAVFISSEEYNLIFPASTRLMIEYYKPETIIHLEFE